MKFDLFPHVWWRLKQPLKCSTVVSKVSNHKRSFLNTQKEVLFVKHDISFELFKFNIKLKELGNRLFVWVIFLSKKKSLVLASPV